MPSTSASRPRGSDELAVEAWGQGLMVGSLMVMIAVTLVNMRNGVLLHKLIVAELVLAIFHGTFIFLHAPAYGWYLSTTAIGLNVSWSLHNLIAWLKLRRFFKGWGEWLFLVTLAAAQPYWVVEIYANFTFFNNENPLFLSTRPLEPLFRDPWWIFASCFLLHTIRRGYNCPLLVLFRISPRFGAMLIFMALSIALTIIDTCAVLAAFHMLLPVGIEPFWKLSFIFKCLSDMIILDDFKTALDRVQRYNIHQFPQGQMAERPTPVRHLRDSGQCSV